MPGPSVRTDIVEAYVFRTLGVASGPRPAHAEFLQLRRAPGSLLPGTWHPVMGHVREGERAAAAVLRELREETGLIPPAMAGLWQLEEPNVFFLQAEECIMMSPGFAVHVAADWKPTLNGEHDDYRWVKADFADRAFLWPGQRRAAAQVVRDILAADSPAEPCLRVDPYAVLRVL